MKKLKKLKMLCMALGASFVIGQAVPAQASEVGVCAIGYDSPCNGSGYQSSYPNPPHEIPPVALEKVFSNADHAQVSDIISKFFTNMYR